MKLKKPENLFSSEELINEFDKIQSLISWSDLSVSALKKMQPPYGLVDIIEAKKNVPDVLTILKALRSMGYTYQQLSTFCGMKHRQPITNYINGKSVPLKVHLEKWHIMLLKKYRKIKKMIPPLGNRVYKI